MTDSNRTEVVCVLDRSGSMNGIWDDAIGGLKSFIEDQKKDKDNTRITLVAFDTEYLEVVTSQSIHEFDFKVLENVRPRGGTALYDALGRSINSVGNTLKDLDEDKRPENVIFCILTDGYENASREFTADTIKDMIGHQTEKYNWGFTYLGANQDAFAAGHQLGIARNCCANIDANTSGMLGSYATYSGAVRNRKSNARAFDAGQLDLQNLVDDEVAKIEEK